jgi:hypothetical protein
VRRRGGRHVRSELDGTDVALRDRGIIVVRPVHRPWRAPLVTRQRGFPAENRAVFFPAVDGGAVGSERIGLCRAAVVGERRHELGVDDLVVGVGESARAGGLIVVDVVVARGDRALVVGAVLLLVQCEDRLLELGGAAVVVEAATGRARRPGVLRDRGIRHLHAADVVEACAER